MNAWVVVAIVILVLLLAWGVYLYMAKKETFYDTGVGYIPVGNGKYLRTSCNPSFGCRN